MSNPFDKFNKTAPSQAAPAAPTAPAAAPQAPSNPFGAFQKPARPQPAAGVAPNSPTPANPVEQPVAVPPQAPPAPASAINLSKLEEKAPGLINLSKAAGISLEKKGLTGVRAAVYLVLDYSGSMYSYYGQGVVQDFSNKILAASVHFDDDGSIPVILFDNRARAVEEVSLDNYQGAITDIASRAGRMSTTNYAAAIYAVTEHYLASGTRNPAFVIFQTDGSPDSRRDAERAICDASKLPIFWQFVGFGNDRFEFLQKLDELEVPKKRVIDNAGFFAAGRDPHLMAPEVLYDNLMSEFPAWLKQAKLQGIVN